MTLPSGGVRVDAIRYGSLEMARSRFFYDYASYGEADGVMEMDYLFFIVRSADETLLVDCGFDPDVARRRGRTPIVTAAEGLAELGVRPDDVDGILVTHFHYDHVGNLTAFPNARLLAQARELEFWSGPVARRRRFMDVAEPAELGLLDDAFFDGRLELVDGTAEISPFVTVELAGGHTPGQQIVRVAVGPNEIVLASDALHCYEEMDRDRPFSLFSDLVGTYAAFDRLRALEDSGARIVAGHDPLVRARFAEVRTGGSEVVIAIA